MDADSNDHEEETEQQTARQRLAQDATGSLQVVSTNGMSYLYREAHGTG